MNHRGISQFLTSEKFKRFDYNENSKERGNQLFQATSGFTTENSPSGINYCGHIYNSIIPDAFSDLETKAISAWEKPGTVKITDLPDDFKLSDYNFDDIPFFSLGESMTDYLTGTVAVIPTGNSWNLSFHRFQKKSADTAVVRIVDRHLNAVLNESSDKIPVSFITGASPEIALGASISLKTPGGELEFAASLKNDDIHLIKSDEWFFPEDCELVFCGYLEKNCLLPEGPFVDITATSDFIRNQPRFSLKHIYSRPHPVIPHILPSGPEHGYLMGEPRRLHIISGLKKSEFNVHDISLTRGGSHWLYAVISLDYTEKTDELSELVFSLHPSLKKVTFVNTDINVNSSEQVEWAESTRCQPHRDIIVFNDQLGSSLDPSSQNGQTSKWSVNTLVKDIKNSEKYRRQLPFLKV
ncbi:MAG: UbiD family decarboxylase [Deltaproteobacteria bacterium]|nr:UbiD family decarboxylase [Deltaproteobacteria bacterium]